MAASDNLNPRLFHGTGGHIEGNEVHPSPIGALGPGAYATDKIGEAEVYAMTEARNQGRLFGTVYEVEPKTGFTGEHDLGHARYLNDPTGLKIKRAVSYPVPEERTKTLREDGRPVYSLPAYLNQKGRKEYVERRERETGGH